MTDITRRGFVVGGATGLVASAAAAAVVVADEAWDEEYDVVIAGGGGAGYVTALTACQANPDMTVRMVEKLSFCGGSSLVSGGNIGAFNTDVIALRADENPDYYSGDTLEMYFEDKISSGDYQSDPELVRPFVDNSNANYEWLKSLGLVWTQTKSYEKAVYEPSDMNADDVYHASTYLQTLNEDGVYPGINRKCRYNFLPVYGDYTEGPAVMACLEDHLAECPNFSLATETRLVGIVREGIIEGPVLGIVVEDASGAQRRIKANKAVVLTTGGFAGNGEMLHMYNGKVDPGTPTLGGVGNTGDGLVAAMLVGAQTVNMYSEQIDFGCIMSDLHSYLFPTKPTAPFANTGCYIEISDAGERFWSEVPPAPQYIEARLTKLAALDMTTWWRLGESESIGAKELSEEDIAEFAESVGYVCETLEEVAEIVGCDVEALKGTLETYNACVEAGVDTQCGKPARFLTQRIEKAPFYLYSVGYACRSTPGGLRIAADTQVLDVRGERIPNLYAVGEVTGNLHGRFRNTGGDSWTELACFGRICGEVVATL